MGKKSSPDFSSKSKERAQDSFKMAFLNDQTQLLLAARCLSNKKYIVFVIIQLFVAVATCGCNQIL